MLFLCAERLDQSAPIINVIERGGDGANGGAPQKISRRWVFWRPDPACRGGRRCLPASKSRTRRRRSMFNVNIQMEKYRYENQNQRQSGVAHSSASAARPEIITARNSKAGGRSGFCFDTSAPVRTPRNGLGLLDPLGLRGETWRTSTGPLARG